MNAVEISIASFATVVAAAGLLSLFVAVNSSLREDVGLLAQVRSNETARLDKLESITVPERPRHTISEMQPKLNATKKRPFCSEIHDAAFTISSLHQQGYNKAELEHRVLYLSSSESTLLADIKQKFIQRIHTQKRYDTSSEQLYASLGFAKGAKTACEANGLNWSIGIQSNPLRSGSPTGAGRNAPP